MRVPSVPSCAKTVQCVVAITFVAMDAAGAVNVAENCGHFEHLHCYALPAWHPGAPVDEEASCDYGCMPFRCDYRCACSSTFRCATGTDAVSWNASDWEAAAGGVCTSWTHTCFPPPSIVPTAEPSAPPTGSPSPSLQPTSTPSLPPTSTADSMLAATATLTVFWTWA